MIYKISFKNPVQIIEAETEEQAIEMFWDNFETYNEGYPDADDLVVEGVEIPF